MHLQFNYTVQIGNSGLLALIGESDIHDPHPSHWAFFMAQIPVGEDRGFLLHLNEHLKYTLGTGCAVIDTDARRVRILRIPYDIAGAQRKIRQAGLPEFLADRLASGD